jgi:hypothetical protein
MTTTWPLRILVYGAGDAVNGAGALDPQIRQQLVSLGRVVTNSVVAAAAQLDSDSSPALRYVLDPAGRLPVEEFPDVNTGDPRELAKFAAWGAAQLPADRTVLVLAGHGIGWQDGLALQALGTRLARTPTEGHARRMFGSRRTPATAETWAVLIDGSERDFLSNAELAMACDYVNAALGTPLDALVFDACLMMSWELATELRGRTKTMVASIDELSASGIDLAGPAYDLSTGIGLTAQSIAASFAQSFVPKAPFDSCVAVDLASMSFGDGLASFAAFAAEIGAWARSTDANAEALRGALRYAATSLVKFTYGGLADIAALAAAIKGISNAPARAVATIVDTRDALNECVLARSTGSDYRNALGLSVFCPNSVTVHMANRDDYNALSFTRATGWGVVLDYLYGVDVVRTRGLRSQGLESRA